MKLVCKITGVAMEVPDNMVDKFLNRGFMLAGSQSTIDDEPEVIEIEPTPAQIRIDEQVQKSTRGRKPKDNKSEE